MQKLEKEANWLKNVCKQQYWGELNDTHYYLEDKNHSLHAINTEEFLTCLSGFGNIWIDFGSLSNTNMQAVSIFAKRCQKPEKGLTT